MFERFGNVLDLVQVSVDVACAIVAAAHCVIELLFADVGIE